ncbi:putative F-box protein At3g16210 [Camellia sinensis]|uniref:putative F-box protein At3g16210 n=1 Tax=Camellia sinensis TaxID=4442 RepID=UPI001035AE2C|nr:putative F-box protein At3g16210 [Camellia sinensis]
MVSHYIHEDVMVGILVKLPVKSLLRFKCVFKFWSSLITNPSFIAKYLTNSNKEENGCLLVHNVDYNDKKYTFAVCRDKTLTVPVFEYLGLKLNVEARVMGPCKGIFCLLINAVSIALWNSANREFRALPRQTYPETIPPRMELENNAFGFGMDPFTDDYKVVSIRMYWDSTLDDPYNFTPPTCYLKHIAIYSLRDDSWRDFKGFFLECFVFSSFEFYTYMDGIYYWCAYDKNGHSMKLSFHMGYEVFQKILEQDEHTRPLPFQGIPELGCPHPGTNLVEHYFGVYKGCLAWIQCYPRRAIPFGFWKNGEILLQVVDGNLVLADPITLEMKELELWLFRLLFTMGACMFHSLECVGYGLDLSSFFGVVFLLVVKISVQKSEENHLVGSVPMRMLEFMASKELSDIQWHPT